MRSQVAGSAVIVTTNSVANTSSISWSGVVSVTAGRTAVPGRFSVSVLHCALIVVGTNSTDGTPVENSQRITAITGQCIMTAVSLSV